MVPGDSKISQGATMNSELFTDEPAPQAPDELFTDEPVPGTEPMTSAGFQKKAIADIKGLGTGLMDVGKMVVDPLNITGAIQSGSMEPIKEAPLKNWEMLKAIPKGIGEEVKRVGIGELATGHPIEAAKTLGRAAYDKPFTTILDFLPAFGAAGKALGIGGKAARGAGLAAEAGEAADLAGAAGKAGKMAGVAEDVAQAGKVAPILEDVAGTTAKASGLEGIAGKIGEKIPGAVKEPMKEAMGWAKEKYGPAGAREGWAETLGNILETKGQGMRLKELGAPPGMVRKLYDKFGREKLSELSNLLKEKGITDPIVSYKIGQNLENMEKMAGKSIGDMRKISAQRGAIHNPQELVDAIKAKLDTKYSKGVASSESGSYAKALEDIANSPPTPEALAKTITNLNQYATKNQMIQKSGAYTDVANTASRINNQLIEKFLSPQEMQAYKAALKEYSAAQVFKRFYSFRVGREFAGRNGPGGLLRNIKQSAMDIGGNKILEKVYDKLGSKLKANPKIANDLGTLTHETLTDILSALDEVIDETIR
jgi:hypothetical protein